MALIIMVVFFLLIDYYFFQGVVVVSKNWTEVWKNTVRIGFWLPTALCLLALAWWTFGDPYRINASARNFIITGIVATYFSKILGILVLFIDDLQRGVRWVANYFINGRTENLPGRAIPRSE